MALRLPSFLMLLSSLLLTWSVAAAADKPDSPGTIGISTDIYYQIEPRSGGDRMVIDVRGGECSQANGAVIQQWERLRGDNQFWHFAYDGARDAYTIVARNSDKVLEIPIADVSKNGTGIEQWQYTSGINQLWTLEPLGGGWYRIRSLASGKVLEIQDGRPNDNGTRLQIWDSRGGADVTNQAFKLDPAGVAKSDRKRVYSC